MEHAVPPTSSLSPSDDSASVADATLRARPDLVVCDSCSTVHSRVELRPGQVARCMRCNALLGRGHVVTLNGTLAFAVAALLCFVIGNLEPMVTLDLRGIVVRTTLIDAIRQTWQAGEPLVALLAAATAVVFPLLLIVLRLYVLVPLAAGHVPSGFVPAMHALRFVSRWTMVEVFMLGALVSIVRSTSIATVQPGFGLLAYAALTMLLTSIAAGGLHTLWGHASELEGR
jgi:paraquat-inducible protein A